MGQGGAWSIISSWPHPLCYQVSFLLWQAPHSSTVCWSHRWANSPSSSHCPYNTRSSYSSHSLAALQMWSPAAYSQVRILLGSGGEEWKKCLPVRQAWSFSSSMSYCFFFLFMPTVTWDLGDSHELLYICFQHWAKLKNFVHLKVIPSPNQKHLYLALSVPAS